MDVVFGRSALSWSRPSTFHGGSLSTDFQLEGALSLRLSQLFHDP